MLFFFILQQLGKREKTISLVGVVRADEGCSLFVVGCPPGGGGGERGKGKAATGYRSCGGGECDPCRTGFEWRVYGFLREVAPGNKVFSLVQGL